MKKKAICILILLISFLSCIEEKISYTPQEIRDKSITSMQKVKTYSFSTIGKLVIPRLTITTKEEGVIDLFSKKAHSNLMISLLGMKFNFEIYTTQDYEYILSSIGKGWVKSRLPKGEWNRKSPIVLLSLLKKLDLSLKGLEKVDNRKCYILEAKISRAEFEPYLKRQIHYFSLIGMDVRTLAKVYDNLDEGYIREYIATDDFTLRRVDFLLHGKINGDPINFEISINLKDYNRGFKIELPKDAMNAKTIEDNYGIFY